LVGRDLATEREHLPVEALASAAALALAGSGAALLILSLREGSVAILLGERMSHRERVLIAGLLVAEGVIGGVLSEKKVKPPFHLTDQGVVARLAAHSRVEVLPPGEPEDGDRLAGFISAALESLATELSIDALPPVFVVQRSDLDGDRFETSWISKREGVLLRANIGSPRFSPEDLVSLIVHEVLEEHTRGRAALERRRWLLDGYAESRSLLSAAAPDLRRETLWLRALYAVDAGASIADLDRWLTVLDRHGPALTSALAWSAVEVLSEDELHRIALAAFGARPPEDIRALLGEQGLDGILARQAGVTTEALLSRWQARIASERARFAERLAGLPKLGGTIAVRSLSPLSLAIDYQVEGSSNADAYDVLYKELGVLDDPIDLLRVSREGSSLEVQDRGTLPRTFAPGTRVYVAFAIHVPELGCEVLSSVERRRAP
jgi:hypothetical protein